MNSAPIVERIGSYGLNSDHEYLDQGKGLRYLKHLPSSFDFDLLEGIGEDSIFEDYQKSFENRDKVGNTITWMIKHQDSLLNNNVGKDGKLFKDIDFVCSNGMFKAMMNFPFDKYYQPNFVIAVSKLKSTYFVSTIPKIKEKRELTQYHIEAAFSGIKFEQLVTRKLDGDEDGVGYYNVMKTTIGGHKLIYPCEVKCIKSCITREPETDDFIELKTAQPFRYRWPNGSDSIPFSEYVSRQWWVQCHMSGINEIAVGVKEQPKGTTGIVRCSKVDRISVISLEQSYGHGPKWTVDGAIDEVAKNLNKIKEVVKEDNPEIVYVFTFETGQQMKIERKKADDDDGKYRVLSKDKIDQLNELELSVKMSGWMKSNYDVPDY